MKISKVQAVILAFLMVWYGWFFLEKINLTTADLGRHLKNGEMVLNGEWGILTTNFYSYTEPGFPVVNHHWGGGSNFLLYLSDVWFYRAVFVLHSLKFSYFLLVLLDC